MENEQFPCRRRVHRFRHRGWVKTEMRLQGSALGPIRDNFDELAVRLGPWFTAEARPTPVGGVPAARDWLRRAGGCQEMLRFLALDIGPRPLTMDMTHGDGRGWQFPEICRTRICHSIMVRQHQPSSCRGRGRLVACSVSSGGLLMAHKNAMSRYQIIKSPTSPQRFSSVVPRVSLSPGQSPNTRLAWPCASLLLGFENPTSSVFEDAAALSLAIA